MSPAALAQERRSRPWGRWLASRKSEGGRARDGHTYFMGDRFANSKDVGLSKAVVKGGGAAKEEK